MSLRYLRTVLAALVGLICAGNAAHAGIITSIATVSLPGASTGTIGPIGATPAPNNDNAAVASANTIAYTIFFNALGPLEVEFVTSNSGGTTEYRYTQTFVNNTGQDWSGFVFELGFGLGATFTPSGGTGGLDFDWPDADPAPTASLLSLLSHQNGRIEWSGGSVPSIGVLTLTFAIDVPDNLSAFNPDEVNRFTLRQIPMVSTQTVPVPSPLLLLGAGVLALMACRRRA